MNMWFTADQHFSHERIIEMTGRPFASVEEMNSVLVANYNALVQPEDVVYFLGDVCMGKLTESLSLLSQLKGHKILAALGNHDRPSHLYHHKTEEKRQEWLAKYQEYFEAIHESLKMELCVPRVGMQPTARLDVMPVLLHHLPYLDDTFVDHAYEGRYREFQPVNDGKTILIHGHVHGAWKQKGRQINVGVDVWDYKPVSLHQLSQLVLPPTV